MARFFAFLLAAGAAIAAWQQRWPLAWGLGVLAVVLLLWRPRRRTLGERHGGWGGGSRSTASRHSGYEAADVAVSGFGGSAFGNSGFN